MSRSLERHWQRARGYLEQRQLTAARVQLESLRALAPGDVRTRLLAAQIAWQEDHVRDAATCALDAAQAAPDDPDVLCDVIDTLLQVGETAVAHHLLERPVWEQAETGDALLRYADFRQRFGEHVQSLATLDRLISKHPDDGAFRCYRGQQLEYLGRLDEAEAEYEACLALVPGFGQAAYRLVRLQRQAPENHYADLIEAGLRCVRPGSRSHAAFEFTRYHVFEGLGHISEAWQSLARANATMYAMGKDDAAQQQAGTQRLFECIQAHPPRTRGESYTGPCPIFIIGMPRSGTTLLERMLANHSQVVATGELVDFAQQLLWVADTRSVHGDAFLSRLPGLDLADAGCRYLAQTAWRARGHAYYVDKQPANWVVAGLIHAALPQAKILHLVRDPMGVCFSNYRAMFGDAYTWSYDFATLAEQYRGYDRLMRHWHAASPGAILDVPYADLVRDPETTLRKVTTFCGLEWEAGCEDITRNAAPVSTLSSTQVRKPVHTRGLGQWRPYAARLEPLQRMLSLT